MRRSLLVGALMATTAITTPSRAAAFPVLGFIQGVVAGLAGSALIGGTVASAGFLTGVAASTYVTGFLGTIGGKLLLGVGLSYLSQALTPTPRVAEPSERMANFAQPVSYAEWVLGRARKGGPLGFTGFASSEDVVTGTTGKKRHYTPILAAHPCEGILTHYLDERVVEIDGNGLVTTDPMSGYYRIRPFLGGAGQTADAEMVNAFSEVTSSFDFAGLTGAHIWAKRPPQNVFSEVYPTGRQGAYTPVIEGHNGVYDPRGGGSTGFTRNAALLMAFWITSILGQQVDWTEVAEEADACDVLVGDAEGGSQPKWLIDGVLSDDQDFEQQRAQMAAACDAWMYEREDGKVGFKVGRWIAPTLTLTQDDFFSVEVTEGSYGRNAPTEVAAQYVEPENAWRETSSGAYVIDAGSRQVREEPALHMVASHNQASRLNKRIAKTKRPRYQLKGTLNLIGYFLRGHRFVRVQVLGIDEVFEVGELWRNDGGWSFDLVGNSVEEEDFDFNAGLEEPDRPVFQQVASSDAVDDVAGLAGAPDGTNGITWSWDDQDASYTQQLRLRKKTTTDWFTYAVPAAQSYVVTSGLETGAVYQAQVRNRTAALREGAWKPDTPAEATVSGVKPGAVTHDDASPEPGRVRFTGTAGTVTTGLRVFRAETVDFSTATPVTPVLPVSPLATYEVVAGDPDAVELCTDPNLEDPGEWTIETDWSMSSGKAIKVVGAANRRVYQPTTIEAGETIWLSALIDNASGANVRLRIDGDTNVDSDTAESDGWIATEVTAPANPAELEILATAGFAGEVLTVHAIRADAALRLPHGLSRYWVVPYSPEGVQGPEDGPYLIFVP